MPVNYFYTDAGIPTNRDGTSDTGDLVFNAVAGIAPESSSTSESSGSFEYVAISAQPTVTAGEIDGISTGIFGVVTASVEPNITISYLSGAETGTIGEVQLLSPLTISASGLLGAQTGSFNSAQTTLDVDILITQISGACTGSIGAVVQTVLPSIAADQLVGEQSGLILSNESIVLPIITLSEISVTEPIPLDVIVQQLQLRVKQLEDNFDAMNADDFATAVWTTPIGDDSAAEALSMAAAESTLARQMQTNKAVISEDGRTVSIYDDDGITLLHMFDISSDKLVRSPS